MAEVLMIIIALAVIGIIYAWWKGPKAMPFDDIIELRFLKSRKKRFEYADVVPLLGSRGVCVDVGKVSPWTHIPCDCTGYEFGKVKRGVQYCKCGCALPRHPLKRKSQHKIEPLDE